MAAMRVMILPFGAWSLALKAKLNAPQLRDHHDSELYLRSLLSCLFQCLFDHGLENLFC